MYLLHITHVSGETQTLDFDSRFVRALFCVGLSSQPVTLRLEDCE